MFPTPSQKYLVSFALTALLAGCGSAASSVPSSPNANGTQASSIIQRTANSFLSPGTPGTVLYESSLDGSPGHGQVLVFTSSLMAHNPHPLRAFNDGTVRPFGMWVDKNGDLWVANIPQGAPTTGVFVYHPGASHPYRNIVDGLANPTHVAVGRDGSAYVNQSQCNNIQGACVTVYPPGSNHPSRSIDMHFSGYALQTGEMAFDKNGNLLVMESNFRQGGHVFRVSTRTFTVTDLKLNIGAADPGLAVDGAFNLYVSGSSIEVLAPGHRNPSRVLNGFSYDIAVLPNGTVYGNAYGGIVEFAPGAINPTNQFASYGNYGLGVAVGPAH